MQSPWLGKRDESADPVLARLETPIKATRRAPVAWSPALDQAEPPGGGELGLSDRRYVALLCPKTSSVGWVFFGADRTGLAVSRTGTSGPAGTDVVDGGGVLLSLQKDLSDRGVVPDPGPISRLAMRFLIRSTSGSPVDMVRQLYARVHVHDVRQGAYLGSVQPRGFGRHGRIECADGRVVEARMFERVPVFGKMTMIARFDDVTPNRVGATPSVVAVAVLSEPGSGYWVEARAVTYDVGCDVALRCLIAAQLISPWEINWSSE
jgi:hypothetical protein